MALVPGQRYISNAEPELGLGTLIRIEGRSVQLLYATAGVLRQYAVHSAPIARAEFRVGQKVSGKGFSLVIESVAEDDGLQQRLLSSIPRGWEGAHPKRA